MLIEIEKKRKKIIWNWSDNDTQPHTHTDIIILSFPLFLFCGIRFLRVKSEKKNLNNIRTLFF